VTERQWAFSIEPHHQAIAADAVRARAEPAVANARRFAVVDSGLHATPLAWRSLVADRSPLAGAGAGVPIRLLDVVVAVPAIDLFPDALPVSTLTTADVLLFLARLGCQGAAGCAHRAATSTLISCQPRSHPHGPNSSTS